MVDFAQVRNYRYTEKSKALQLQVTAAESDDGTQSETGFADAFSAWCLVAVPLRPVKDADGNISAACEAAVIDGADERTVIGTRDIRVSRYAQDLRPGECAFINGYGSRLSLRAQSVTLNHGGGFLSFDSAGKTVSIVGIPSTSGGNAPYLSISPTTIGLTSETGQSSIVVSAGDATINAATVNVRAAQIRLGNGAAEPIVTYSMLMKVIAALAAASITIPPIPPGKSVLVPFGG